MTSEYNLDRLIDLDEDVPVGTRVSHPSGFPSGVVTAQDSEFRSLVYVKWDGQEDTSCHIKTFLDREEVNSND